MVEESYRSIDLFLIEASKPPASLLFSRCSQLLAEGSRPLQLTQAGLKYAFEEKHPLVFGSEPCSLMLHVANLNLEPCQSLCCFDLGTEGMIAEYVDSDPSPVSPLQKKNAIQWCVAFYCLQCEWSKHRIGCNTCTSAFPASIIEFVGSLNVRSARGDPAIPLRQLATKPFNACEPVSWHNFFFCQHPELIIHTRIQPLPQAIPLPLVASTSSSSLSSSESTSSSPFMTLSLRQNLGDATPLTLPSDSSVLNRSVSTMPDLQEEPIPAWMLTIMKSAPQSTETESQSLTPQPEEEKGQPQPKEDLEEVDTLPSRSRKNGKRSKRRNASGPSSSAPSSVDGSETKEDSPTKEGTKTSWSPFLPKESFFRQKLCSYYFYTGKCSKGESCNFSHEIRAGMTPPKRLDEIGTSRPSPTGYVPVDKLKGTKPCKWFVERGWCRKGDACTFSHDEILLSPEYRAQNGLPPLKPRNHAKERECARQPKAGRVRMTKAHGESRGSGSSGKKR